MNEIQQPVRQPVSSSITIPRLIAIVVLVFGLSAIAVRCVAVASQSDGVHSGHAGAGIPAKAGPPLTIEQLAEKAGCTPKIQTEAAELRQGYCPTATGRGRYFMTTFTTTQGQQEWVTQAVDYGALLVGNRWVVGANLKTLQQLQPKLGGDIIGHSHGG